MKNLLIILTTILIVVSGCSSDDNIDVTTSPVVQKPYNPYFINQSETIPNPIRDCGKDSIYFKGTRFVIDDSLSNIKHIEFRHIDTLIFIGDKNRMTNLKSLNFFATRMKNLPKGLSEFKNLENLTIKKSATLSTFPNFICKLKKLKSLKYYLGRNLDSIPDCIGDLQDLEYLDLSRNNISHIPTTISKLKKLKTLILWDNPISEKELEDLKLLLPNTAIYTKTTPYN